jgi:hypothetical protein
MYFSQIKLDPQRALTYVEENRNKQIVYERFLYNSESNIGIGTDWSKLVNSGIKNPVGIAIIPLISKVSKTFAQYESPYDTCPATYSPLSLINLQVSLGGQNVLNTALAYTFENFLEQVALAETLTSSDFGVSVGLINQSWWETAGRVYWVDLSRSRDADKASERNVNVSFKNNNNIAIDVLFFTVYLDRFVIDVETGIVQK